jgi:hypothetical protein
MAKYRVEFIGTFFLVATVGLTVLSSAGPEGGLIRSDRNRGGVHP